MKEALRQHITRRLGREPENIHLVLPHFEELESSRGEHILHADEVCRYVYFIVEGCLQVYVIDKNGQESTRELYVEDQWTTDIFGFRNQSPSREYIKCAEPCKLLRIHHDSFQVLAEKVPQFRNIYQNILEVSYNNTVYRVNTLTSMDALERIRWFQENKPRLMARLPAKLIASYLGISPETFTRLRSKL